MSGLFVLHMVMQLTRGVSFEVALSQLTRSVSEDEGVP